MNVLGMPTLQRALKWAYRNSGLRPHPASYAAPRLTPPINGDIKRWCQEHVDADYQVLARPQMISRQPPRTLESEIDPALQPYLQLGIPEKALVRVSNARLVGHNGLVMLPDGSFVGQLIANGPDGWRTMLAKERAYYSPLPKTRRALRGRYFSLMVIGWHNYYHWNHDVIIKLHTVFQHLPRDIRFIAPPELKPFHFDTLRLLGIEPDQLIHFRADELWECDSLYFTVPYPKPSTDTPELLAWFREQSHSMYGSVPPRPMRRIYLSRRDDTHFRTVNEAEVMDVLREYKFEPYQPARMSFREQVALFSEAEMIVGTGTGLFNMMFAARGARILQLQEPSHMVVALWTLSEALGHSYWYLCGETVPNRDFPSHDADISVPIGKLKETLEHMLT